MQCCNIRSSLIITFIVFTFVQRKHDSDDSFSSAATNRYNLLEATTESDSDGNLHHDSGGRSSCAGEQQPPSRTDSVKTLCYDAEDYESINSFSLPEVQAESRSRGNAGDPFDANDQFDFNPAMISACLFRFIRQHYLFDSVSGGQAIPEGYEPLKPAASIWPSNEPAPGCQHFV